MANNVTNKITFKNVYTGRVKEKCMPEGYFDFETLVPPPAQVYRGNLSLQEDEDFKCNWSTWNRANWGTKWNAYNSCLTTDGDAGTRGDTVVVFDTAWTVPYPIVAAFANTLKIPFEHRYFDEGEGFWGIERWEMANGVMTRVSTRKSLPEDRETIRQELLGGIEDVDG